MEVTGWPVGTVVRGHRVMWDGSLVDKAQGECVQFGEALVV
jgi:dihydroorotase